MHEPSPFKFRALDFMLFCAVAVAIALASLALNRAPEQAAAAVDPSPTRSPAATPVAERKGTWICEDSNGGQTAIGNPANCGPDDLVLWCEVWEVNEATGSGKCVG